MKSRAKFDYMNFEGGSEGTEFVCHAGKYSKQEAVELCIGENDYLFDTGHNRIKYRYPTTEDIVGEVVAWYPSVPEWCGYDDTEGGCYTYCQDGRKNAFPVHVIKFESLRVD